MKKSRFTRENFCFSFVLNFRFIFEFEICIFSIEFDFCSLIEFEFCSSFCDLIDDREELNENAKWRDEEQFDNKEKLVNNWFLTKEKRRVCTIDERRILITDEMIERRELERDILDATDVEEVKREMLELENEK